MCQGLRSYSLYDKACYSTLKILSINYKIKCFLLKLMICHLKIAELLTQFVNHSCAADEVPVYEETLVEDTCHLLYLQYTVHVISWLISTLICFIHPPPPPPPIKRKKRKFFCLFFWPLCKLLHSFALEGAFGTSAGKSFGSSGKFSTKHLSIILNNNWSIIIKMLYFYFFIKILF